jgi:predicted metal-dependent peptidase
MSCPKDVPTSKWLSRARAKLMIHRPFHGSMVLGSEIIEDPRIQTMATDGKDMYYNDAFVRSLTVPQLAGILAHEADHIVLLHVPRRRGRPPVKWNYACDYTINETLKSEEEPGILEMIDEILYNPKYLNWSAEKIFNDLEDADIPENAPEHFTGGDSGEDDSDGEGGGGEGNEGLNETEGHPGLNPDEMTSEELEELEAQAIRRALAAAETAKAQGKLPQQYSDMVQQMAAPQIDWKELLPRAVIGDIPCDYTYRRCNRKFAGSGFYMPAVYKEGVGNVYVWRDTSGSVPNNYQGAFLTQMKFILDDARPESLVAVDCDSYVQRVDTFYPGDDLSSIKRGGCGGTDPNAFFDWVVENGVNVQAVVCLTDMGFGYGSLRDPGYPVTWVSCDKAKEPPFGQYIYMEKAE